MSSFKPWQNAKRERRKARQATDSQNGGVIALTKELFQAAITLRGSVEPADYKRYVHGFSRRPAAPSPGAENPSFVIQVDRTDLDDQLFDQFVAVRSLVGEVKHADSVEQLRDLLATSGGEVIFTTIEKFRLRTDRGEFAHPVLSERSNIIVIADEAHR